MSGAVFFYDNAFRFTTPETDHWFQYKNIITVEERNDDIVIHERKMPPVSFTVKEKSDRTNVRKRLVEKMAKFHERTYLPDKNVVP